MAQAEKKKDKSKKRVVTIEATGQIHIQATFNNIIISLTNKKGDVISWGSAGTLGRIGQRGSRGRSPHHGGMNSVSVPIRNTTTKVGGPERDKNASGEPEAWNH